MDDILRRLAAITANNGVTKFDIRCHKCGDKDFRIVFGSSPREQTLIALVQDAAREIERLRAALRGLCPHSLTLALKELGSGYDEMDVPTAQMHISCELQRMEEAVKALNPQEPAS